MKSNSKITVGLSGGVDSAVAAYLMQQQGYEVNAVFMQNWNKETEQCTQEQDLSAAIAVAKHLNIELDVVNFASDYWHYVFEKFLEAHQKGYTPNPDILCNSEIKFKKFLNYALSRNSDAIATGHYANLSYTDGKWNLQCAKDTNKDQTYFLHQLSQQQLEKSIFPLGNYEKKEVRAIAKKINLPNFDKKDSTGICFIGEKNYNQFLQQYVLAKPGNIVDVNNKVIGNHRGLMFYTIGQRKGIGLGGTRGLEQKPWYVIGKNLSDNTLIVDQGKDSPLLFKNNLLISEVNWNQFYEFEQISECFVKIRYMQVAVPCRIEKYTNGYKVIFKDPQRAITPGQYAVFYKDNNCLGGGIINGSC